MNSDAYENLSLNFKKLDIVENSQFRLTKIFLSEALKNWWGDHEFDLANPVFEGITKNWEGDRPPAPQAHTPPN